MISAREFCREHGFPATIFPTYSFDPLFFERIPIDDLDVAGTRRIVIAADAGKIAEAMQRCIGQIVHLGRRYVLAETKAANTFHPKMIVRLSPSGGRVWIGSGNLTYTGWGGNQELATAWSVGPGTQDNGAWLNTVFNAVGSITRSATFLSQIDAIRSLVPWLGAPTRRRRKVPSCSECQTSRLQVSWPSVGRTGGSMSLRFSQALQMWTVLFCDGRTVPLELRKGRFA
jgi:hypothetical protein